MITGSRLGFMLPGRSTEQPPDLEGAHGALVRLAFNLWFGWNPRRRVAVIVRALVVLNLCACAVDESNFAARRARVVCNLAFKCDLESYTSEYQDEAECREALETAWNESTASLENFGCTIDYDGGGECLSEIRGRSCDEAGDGELEGDACDSMILCE